MIHIIHCYSSALPFAFGRSTGLTSIQILYPAFVTQNYECESVWLIHNVLLDFGQRLLFLPGVISSVDNVAFASWHAITEWIAHSGVGTPSHGERQRREGRKALWWKDWTQPPTRTLSLPPSLPCPVELIWQRGGSISQFTQATAAFFVCCAFSFAHLACVSTPIHLSFLCVYACLPMFASVLFCMHWAVE